MSKNVGNFHSKWPNGLLYICLFLTFVKPLASLELPGVIFDGLWAPSRNLRVSLQIFGYPSGHFLVSSGGLKTTFRHHRVPFGPPVGVNFDT